MTRFLERIAGGAARLTGVLKSDSGANVAPILVDADDERLKFYDRTNDRAVVVSDQFLRTADLTAVTALTAADSGKVLFLNSATEFAVTLPTAAAGLVFEFYVKAAPSGASYTIVSASSANIIVGQIFSSDLNAASDGDFETSGGDTITLVDGKSVVGDRVRLVCDGTNWYATIYVSVFDAATITTAS